MNIVEELERFSFCVPKEKMESSDLENFGYIQLITLQYKINWPLHLLFSPKVIEKYNELFRFLLLIKRTQYDLHTVWCHHRKERSHQNVNILQLRNQLMFLIDNLQYYIQVDVLESRFNESIILHHINLYILLINLRPIQHLYEYCIKFI